AVSLSSSHSAGSAGTFSAAALMNRLRERSLSRFTVSTWVGRPLEAETRCRRPPGSNRTPSPCSGGVLTDHPPSADHPHGQPAGLSCGNGFVEVPAGRARPGPLPGVLDRRRGDESDLTGVLHQAPGQPPGTREPGPVG